ncbi:MAG TPA: YlxR family protein [Actinomycetota bacterium]
MKGRSEPERTCVGCRARAPKASLVRIRRSPDGDVSVDPTGSAPGRGAYVHAATPCAAMALRRGALARALRVTLGESGTASLMRDLDETISNRTGAR